MRPLLYRIPEWVPVLGDQPITAFGVMLLVAFIAAGALFDRRLRAAEPGAGGWPLVVAAVVGGLVGAKLLHLAVHAALGLPGGGLSRAGLNWLGGLAGGAGTLVWAARRQRLRAGAVLAAAASPAALGYAIGRVGSFLVGADYGVPTGLPWGMPFPAGTPPTTPTNLESVYGLATPPAARWGAFTRVHPAQLYGVAHGLVTLAALEWARRRERWRGAGGGDWRLFGLFVILHGSGRVLVEPLRAKQDTLFGPVTVDLLLALLVVAAGATLLRARGRA